MPVEAEQIRAGLDAAFDRFLSLWARYGGHRYYGRPSASNPRAYGGPIFWSEKDCVYRLALELEKNFPQQVHLEFKMSASSLYDFDVERGDKQLSVDMAVSDLGDFVEGEASHRRFGSKSHELFIEAKYLHKGFWGNSIKNAVDGVARDAANQQQRLRRGRCQVAALFVVDDENAFEDKRSTVPIPDEVILLVASPVELQRRGITVPAPRARAARTR